MHSIQTLGSAKILARNRLSAQYRCRLTSAPRFFCRSRNQCFPILDMESGSILGRRTNKYREWPCCGNDQHSTSLCHCLKENLASVSLVDRRRRRLCLKFKSPLFYRILATKPIHVVLLVVCVRRSLRISDSGDIV